VRQRQATAQVCRSASKSHHRTEAELPRR
jgi:hypothetical protein